MEMIAINAVVKLLLVLHASIVQTIRKFFSLGILAIVIAQVAAFSQELLASNVTALVLPVAENPIVNA